MLRLWECLAEAALADSLRLLGTAAPGAACSRCDVAPTLPKTFAARPKTSAAAAAAIDAFTPFQNDAGPAASVRGRKAI